MVTDPSTARRKRMWWVVVTAVVAVLALAGGLVVAFGSPWTSRPDRSTRVADR
jgi:hypothetical protein